MTRRLLLAVLSILAVALAVSAFSLIGLSRHPETALEAWRAVDRARYGARGGELTLSSGERIAYTEQGKPQDPALVLVHGLRGESTVMLPLGARLSDGGYRVLALDLPGHGRSDPPRRPLTIGRAGAVLVEALEALDAPRPRALIGHSMGGWIVGWTALGEPERCSAVVLISSGGLRFELPPFHVLAPADAAEMRRSLPYLFHDPPHPPGPVLSVAASRPMTGSLDLLRSALSGEHLLDGLLPGLVPRALIVWGADDRLIPPQVGRRMAAAIPRAERVEVPEAGHMVVWERPDAVAGAILDFLE